MLFQFGTGPIKGFAITLILGICMSLLTAVLVTRLIFESYLSANPIEELSI
jgi:preprotein translocase subunit SecD